MMPTDGRSRAPSPGEAQHSQDTARAAQQIIIVMDSLHTYNGRVRASGSTILRRNRVEYGTGHNTLTPARDISDTIVAESAAVGRREKE
jgi:hypothetical protein